MIIDRMSAFIEPVLLMEGEGMKQRFRIVKLEKPNIMEIRERERGAQGAQVGYRVWANEGDERSIPTNQGRGMRIFRETLSLQRIP